MMRRATKLGTVWGILILSSWLLIEARAQTAQDAFVRDVFVQDTSARTVAAVGMTVTDMDRSVAFFSDVLSFEEIFDVEVAGSNYERLQGVFGLRMRVVRMQLGDERIELQEYLAPPGGRPLPVDSRSNDLWFQHIAIVVSDMDTAYQRLRAHKVEQVSPAPQTIPDWNTAAAGIQAFYFRDPDGHNLELIAFPAGKGDPKWQQPSDKLFLGIDHTAIAVSSTATSLSFYRDLLGLTVAGESENYGTEQERLNNVFGARLRITGLRAEAGPGIEFLEYRTPSDGRPMPHDVQANDMLYWQTTLVVNDIAATEKQLRTAHAVFVSPGIVALPKNILGFTQCFLVRDPDGHVIQIVQK